MKRTISVCLAVGLLLALAAVAMAGVNPGTGIKQTSHDLSSGGVGGAYNAGTEADPTLDRICIYCHAPHFTIKPGANGMTYMPLWNHTVTAITTYTTYTNGIGPNNGDHSLNAVQGDLGSVSKLCMSCHDGVVAISAYGGDGTSGSKYAGGVAATGRISIGNGLGDLSNHHPVGFVYDTVAALDDEIAPSDSFLLGANIYNLTIGDLLWQDKMECSTCHDVHNTKNEGSKFTWVQDTRSNLCLTCHLK